jgi:hypothetical protein
LLLVYVCERPGLPKPADQRAACVSAGASEDEMAAAWVDDCRRKVRAGEPAQPQRDYMIGAAREGDDVLVARLGVLATTRDDAMRFVAALGEHGCGLRDASTGRRYMIRPEAARDVSDALRLAADIEADETRSRMEKARRGKKGGKTGGAPSPSPERLEAARPLWFDHRLSEAEVVERSGIKGRTLRRKFGNRGTPAFGRALNKLRGKT